MYRLLLAAAVVMAAFVVAPAAEAQQQIICLPTERLAERLADEYAEQPLMQGVAGPGGLVVVYANPASGTWTLTLQRPEGVSCIIAEGDGFEALPYQAQEPAGDEA